MHLKLHQPDHSLPCPSQPALGSQLATPLPDWETHLPFARRLPVPRAPGLRSSAADSIKSVLCAPAPSSFLFLTTKLSAL